jgi:hypothetical protein
MTRIVRHRKLVFIPPPIAPAYCPQGYAHLTTLTTVAWSRRRRARRGSVFEPFEPLQSRGKSSPSAFPTGRPEASSLGTVEALP